MGFMLVMNAAEEISKVLNLLEPGQLLSGPLFRSLLDHQETSWQLSVGAKLGPFVVAQELGRGGMGVVYLAERADGEFQQQVAIKCIANRRNQSAHDQDRLILFRRERQLLSELKHPNIARLIDAGSNTDALWFAMEMVHGLTIDLHVKKMPNDAKARIELILQLTDAVSAAHARLLVHRDIKPSNVMIDADGTLKLLDFGIAQLQAEPPSVSATAYSPQWASPEQLRREAIGPASDQYQIGRILELATKDLALSGERRLELSAIIKRAMSDTPAHRFGSVDEMARDLRAWLAGNPIRAVEMGFLYPLRCLFRRRPWASSAVLGATVAAITAALWFNWQLQVQRDVAKAAAARAERAQLQQGNLVRFLTDDLLFQGSLYEGEGLNTPVAKLLERAEKKLLDPQILPKAEFLPLLMSMAEVYGSHFQRDRALQLLETALQVAKANSKQVGYAETLEIRYRIATNAVPQARPEQLVLQYEQLDRDAQAFNPNSDTAINVGADLAWRYYETSNFIAMREQVRQLSIRLQSVDQIERASVRYAQQIAAVLSYIDDQAENARAALIAIRKSLRQTLPEGHASIMRSDRNLAVIDRETGQCSKALGQMTAIAKQSTAMPAVDRAWTATELGITHLRCGQIDVALAQLTSAFQVRQSILGNEHFRTRQSAINLARALLAAKRELEAQPLLKPVCPAIAQQFNAKHWQYGQCMAIWAEIQQQLGQSTSAEQAAKIALDVLSPLPGYIHQNGQRLLAMRQILAQAAR